INVTAPSVMPYEVAHALSRAVRRNRVGHGIVVDAYRRLLDWGIPLVHDDDDLLDSLRRSQVFACSLYDASYLALADRLQAPRVRKSAESTIVRRQPSRGTPRATRARSASTCSCSVSSPIVSIAKSESTIRGAQPAR